MSILGRLTSPFNIEQSINHVQSVCIKGSLLSCQLFLIAFFRPVNFVAKFGRSAFAYTGWILNDGDGGARASGMFSQFILILQFSMVAILVAMTTQ